MTLSRETMEVIGANIRRERLIRRMSMDELAEILQLSAAFVGLIERGQRGAKLANLMKIADVFGITVNDLVYSKSSDVLEVREEWEGHEKPVESTKQQKKDAIMSLIYDFSVEEMEFVIDSIKGLKTLKRNSKKDYSGEESADYDNEDDTPVNY